MEAVLGTGYPTNSLEKAKWETGLFLMVLCSLQYLYVLFTFCYCKRSIKSKKGWSWLAGQVHFHCTSRCCGYSRGVFWRRKYLMVMVLKKLELASEVYTHSVPLFCLECRDLRIPWCTLTTANKFPRLKGLWTCSKSLLVWVLQNRNEDLTLMSADFYIDPQ